MSLLCYIVKHLSYIPPDLVVWWRTTSPAGTSPLPEISIVFCSLFKDAFSVIKAMYRRMVISE
jgi:hypothetical protein